MITCFAIFSRWYKPVSYTHLDVYKRQGMENQFIRHEPCFERILFVLTLDRKKMKERILIGEEQQIRFRLNGSQNAEVLCDMTRPLGTFLINFERDTDRDLSLIHICRPMRRKYILTGRPSGMLWRTARNIQKHSLPIPLILPCRMN